MNAKLHTTTAGAAQKRNDSGTDVSKLIASHRRAQQRFSDYTDIQDRAETAWRKRIGAKPVLFPVRISADGGTVRACEMSEYEDENLAQIESSHGELRFNTGNVLRDMAPEAIEAFEAGINRSELACLAAYRKARATYDRRRAGYTAIEAEYDRRSDAERKALLALMSYVPASVEEVRYLASYLFELQAVAPVKCDSFGREYEVTLWAALANAGFGGAETQRKAA
jgi:hypothetical protein